MTIGKRQRAIRRALLWEAFWIPIEMLAVAAGLFLVLTTHWDTLDSLMLWAFLWVDLIVRLRHYQRVGPEIHGASPELSS
jgi:hypothetical protein